MVLLQYGFQIITILVLTFLIRHCGAEAFLEFTENDVISLYNNYREALEENEIKSFRRVFINNIEYQMHVNKLKDVNGLKLHNLILRTENQPNVNKTIYINNPLESKIPHPFLSFDEFKQTLTERIQKQKEEVRKENLKAELENARMNKTKTTIKPRPLGTIYFLRATEPSNAVKHKIENASSKTTKIINKLNTKSTKGDPKAQKTTKSVPKKITTKPKFIMKIAAKEQIKTILSRDISKAKSTKPTTITTKKKFILRAISNAKTLSSSEPNAMSTKPTAITTKKKLIIRALPNPTTRKPLLMQSKATTNHTTTITRTDNETTKSTIETKTELYKEITTAKDSKETNMKTLVPNENETTEAVVTNANVTDTTTAESETTILETEATETQTEESTTTTISTWATLGRPAVYMG